MERLGKGQMTFRLSLSIRQESLAVTCYVLFYLVEGKKNAPSHSPPTRPKLPSSRPVVLGSEETTPALMCVLNPLGPANLPTCGKPGCHSEQISQTALGGDCSQWVPICIGLFCLFRGKAKHKTKINKKIFGLIQRWQLSHFIAFSPLLFFVLMNNTVYFSDLTYLWEGNTNSIQSVHPF